MGVKFFLRLQALIVGSILACAAYTLHAQEIAYPVTNSASAPAVEQPSSTTQADPIENPPLSTLPNYSHIQISLATVAPGEIYWERFGHNMLLVEDTRTGLTDSVNYGMFDFEQPNFLSRFLQGKMLYQMAVLDAQSDLAMYIEQGRKVEVQTLNFTSAQKRRLLEHLSWNAKPENRDYRYDYFLSNCSTKIRDALDLALSGALRASSIGRSRGFTFRMHAQRLTSPDFWLYHGIDLGLGPFADKPITFWDEMFIPMELSKQLGQIQTSNDLGESVALVSEKQVRNAGTLELPPDYPPQWRWWYLLAGLLIASLFYAASQSHKRWWQIVGASFHSIYCISLSMLGCLLLALWFLTDHQSAWANENLLLCNPLLILLTHAAWQKSPALWAKRLAIVCAAIAVLAILVKVLPEFKQANLDWGMLLAPIHVVIALSLYRRCSSNSKPA